MQNNTASSVAAILEECERLRATDPAQLDSKEWRDRLEQVGAGRVWVRACVCGYVRGRACGLCGLWPLYLACAAQCSPGPCCAPR